MMNKYYVKVGEFERVGLAENELEAGLAAYRMYLKQPVSVDTNMTTAQQCDVLTVPRKVYISQQGFRTEDEKGILPTGDLVLTTHYLTQVMLKRQNQFDPDYDDVDDAIPYAEGVDDEPDYDYNV